VSFYFISQNANSRAAVAAVVVVVVVVIVEVIVVVVGGVEVGEVLEVVHGLVLLPPRKGERSLSNLIH
jgi:hypothetical protein